jgi:ketosteroid isomerase-like protein
MSTDPKAVIEGAYAAWQARNLPALLALLADDMVFALHVPADVLPIGGETRGKTAVAAVLQGLLDGYDFLAYEPSPVIVDGARVESEVRFQYRQKATGEVIDSRLHHRWSIADGKVTRLEEWHDLPTVRAFFDRVALRVASDAQRG